MSRRLSLRLALGIVFEMPTDATVRLAAPDEKKALEDLQRQASLVWEEYREELLAHRDAIELPFERLNAGHTRVAERDGQILGFCEVLPLPETAMPILMDYFPRTCNLATWHRPTPGTGSRACGGVTRSSMAVGNRQSKSPRILQLLARGRRANTFWPGSGHAQRPVG